MPPSPESTEVLDIINISIKIILSLFRVYIKLKKHLKKILQMKLEEVFYIYKLNYMYINRGQTCYTVHRFAKQCIWFMILVAVGFAQDNSSEEAEGTLGACRRGVDLEWNSFMTTIFSLVTGHRRSTLHDLVYKFLAHEPLGDSSNYRRDKYHSVINCFKFRKDILKPQSKFICTWHLISFPKPF